MCAFNFFIHIYSQCLCSVHFQLILLIVYARIWYILALLSNDNVISYTAPLTQQAFCSDCVVSLSFLQNISFRLQSVFQILLHFLQFYLIVTMFPQSKKKSFEQLTVSFSYFLFNPGKASPETKAPRFAAAFLYRTCFDCVPTRFSRLLAQHKRDKSGPFQNNERCLHERKEPVTKCDLT